MDTRNAPTDGGASDLWRRSRLMVLANGGAEYLRRGRVHIREALTLAGGSRGPLGRAGLSRIGGGRKESVASQVVRAAIEVAAAQREHIQPARAQAKVRPVC
jgi:hypothetical protein